MYLWPKMAKTRSANKAVGEQSEAEMEIENPFSLGASADNRSAEGLFLGKETGARPKEVLGTGAGDVGEHGGPRGDVVLNFLRDEVTKRVSQSMEEVAMTLQRQEQLNSQMMQNGFSEILQKLELGSERGVLRGHGDQERPLGAMPAPENRGFGGNERPGSRGRLRRRVYSSVRHRARSRSRYSGHSSTERSVNEEDLTSFSQSSNQRARANRRNARLPPYMGKDNWEVWLNRFTDVANIRNWGDHDKLEEILPLMQGSAGEFVFGQLSQGCRSNYSCLIEELNNRFQLVECRKTFSAQFSHRCQKPGETVENFAADLKRLYDKAYPDRDRQTRKEDLLRRFLDGLNHEKARFHVEFTKDPPNIEQAIIEVVNFMETNHRIRDNESERRKSRPTRVVHENMSVSGESDTDSTEAARVARNTAKPKIETRSQTKETKSPENKDANSELLQEVKELKTEFQNLTARVAQLESNLTSRSPRTYPPRYKYTGGRAQPRPPVSNRSCYRCGQEGHFARSCAITGQLQLTTQNPTTPQTENANQADPN